MGEIHIAEIGELFINEDGFDFLSDQNMLEYDFILIDNDWLIGSIHEQPMSLIQDRFNDLKDFISTKKIPVVFFCSKGGRFASLTFSSSIYECLDIDVTEKRTTGKKIEIKDNTLFSDFLKRNVHNFDYSVGFSTYPGTSIGNAKSQALSIGFYTTDFVFLPSFAEETDYDESEFLSELYEICRNIRKDEPVLNIPKWANGYLLPGEKDEKEKLKKIESEIARLNEQRVKSENRFSTFLSLKQLWSGSGTVLESAVKKVFEELGFTMLRAEPGRDDIIMTWKEQTVIVEVKGQNKSAAEKNAAQLEKWVSTYLAEKDVTPKGILLVNTYRELPLADRTQPSFPNQMLGYSKARKHCLMTTLQLCTLLLYCRANPNQKDSEVEKLLNTVGPYQPSIVWNEFIETQK